jgi:hypothetical protein
MNRDACTMQRFSEPSTHLNVAVLERTTKELPFSALALALSW